jgi:Male sterility protein
VKTWRLIELCYI